MDLQSVKTEFLGADYTQAVRIGPSGLKSLTLFRHHCVHSNRRYNPLVTGDNSHGGLGSFIAITADYFSDYRVISEENWR